MPRVRNGFRIGNRLGEFYWTWLVEKPRATIIFSHGNGEHLGFLGDEMLEMARRLRVNVVAYDYLGHGKSIGKPSETSVLEDVVTVDCYCGPKS